MVEEKQVVYVTNWYPAFCFNFHLTGVHFRSELQHVDDVNEHKFRYRPIRTLEITDIRLLHELDEKFEISEKLQKTDCLSRFFVLSSFLPPNQHNRLFF